MFDGAINGALAGALIGAVAGLVVWIVKKFNTPGTATKDEPE